MSFVTGDPLALLLAVSVGLFGVAMLASYLGCCVACKRWLSLGEWLDTERNGAGGSRWED